MSETFYKRNSCRLCQGHDLELVLPLTPSALCDAYVGEEVREEVQECYPLELYLCRDCGYVFLPYVVAPEAIYKDYIYVTTSSLGLADHFRGYTDQVAQKIAAPADALVIDIGSNDGTLLSFFREKGFRVLGIEPADEIAELACSRGVLTLPEFFTCQLAGKIAAQHGQASLITINNLFANIDELDEITSGVSSLLADEGVLVIESSYLADMINNMVFDFAYHEHLSYFSVKPLVKFFARFGLELFDIDRVPTKGGSLRYYIKKKGGSRPVTPAVAEMIDYETAIGLDRGEIFADFARRIDLLKAQLVETLQDLKQKGKSIAGYGASATSTTLLYHFGVGSLLDYLVDDNPAKQNTFSPGLHIPVLKSEALYERRPDYVVMLAWRYLEPIARSHQRYLDQGGHFLRPLPHFEII